MAEIQTKQSTELSVTRKQKSMRGSEYKSTLRREQTRIKRKMILAGDKKCHVCGFDCTPVLQIHHVTPLELGGGNEENNLKLLCPNCHSIIHSFMADTTEKNYGLEYLVEWMNTNLQSEQINRFRELWDGMIGGSNDESKAD